MPEKNSEDPKPDQKANPAELFGLDPRELLARSLHTLHRSAGASPWEPLSIEEVGRLLPQYRIESLIGRGGMGAVYKGIQLGLERPVAIKLLPGELAGDAEFLERFKREARSLARLQHSRIVTIHDFGQTTEGHPYFVMEYVDGTNLRELLRGPGLDPDHALIMVGQLCDALQAAHHAGIVHRDIKPENVLIARDGSVKLADFGIARPTQEEDEPGLTGTNVAMGTTEYMAPEQRDGRADQRADIYALGVVLYEMLTGKYPRGAFDPPSQGLEIDIRIDQVVLKALQMRPEMRYQQASEMKTDVEHIRSTPRQSSKPLPPLKEPRRPSTIAIVAAILVVALGIAALFSRKNPGQTETGTHPAILTPDRKLEELRADQPRENFLGMKFVPVPNNGGPGLFFSIWETRVRDFAAFVNETGYQSNARINNTDLPLHPDPGPLSWKNPGFPQTGDHPVVGVTFQDATAFCRWLTKRERDAGRLEPGQEYRLPTDREWSAALGVQNEPGDFPEDRRFPDGIFSWGDAWPPPANAENLAGEEQPWAHITGYRDDWAWTSPAGSGKGNRNGIFDLSGNVREFCKDRRSIHMDEHGVRGACFQTRISAEKSGGARGSIVGLGTSADLVTGFRCVLDLKSPERLLLARQVEAAVAKFLAQAPADFTQCRDRTDYLVNDETVTLDLYGAGSWPGDDDLAACFAGLPIERLYLTGGSLRTFDALKGAPLKVIALQGTDVDSFEGLRGIPLAWFYARGTTGSSKVTSMDGLREMNLKGLHLERFQGLTDLSAFQGQPLATVCIVDCGVNDVSPLKGSPIRSLTLWRNNIPDLRFLEWWPTLGDFSGMDEKVEAEFIQPALDALGTGDERLAQDRITELGTRFHSAPWLNRNLLLRDLKNGQLVKFAHWVKGDRAEVTRDLKTFAGHAYLFVQTGMHWNSARALAESLGGHLVTVTSKEEDEFLRREVLPRNGSASAWLGLSSAPGVYGWKWVTGEPFDYAAWDPTNGAGQALRAPDQNYACWHPSGTQLYWWDYADFNTRTTVIEWEVPNPQDLRSTPAQPLTTAPSR